MWSPNSQPETVYLTLETYPLQSNINMIITATIAASMTLKVVESKRMKMYGTDPEFHDWRDDLARDGYAVVKGAIPPAKAIDYSDRMYSWLEGL
jgi:hypothetical protein